MSARIVKRYGQSIGTRFAAVEFDDGRRVDVRTRGSKDGRLLNAWGEPYPYDETRAAEVKAMAETMRANPRGRRKARKHARRRNPPNPRAVPVKSFGGTNGHLVSREVQAVEYLNVGSAQAKPYRHDFDSDGVEMWALKDGSILLRHPRHRLWGDFIVGDSE